MMGAGGEPNCKGGQRCLELEWLTLFECIYPRTRGEEGEREKL